MTSDGLTGDGPAWAVLFKQQRARSGLSLDALATACAIAKNTVWRWENGEGFPTDDVWPALHKALPGLPPPPRMGKPKPSYEDLLADNERLRALAMIDELTELPNDRSVYDSLDKALRAAHRGGEWLAVAHLDLDHFKKFNDEDASHKTGDEALKAFAACASGSIRDDDFFGRLHGEEFVAIFDKANPQQARMLAERIRGRVEQLKVRGHRVTVSIGVACFQAPDLSLEELKQRQLPREQCILLRDQLLAQADQATYWAKDDGRNTVVLWSAEEKNRREVAAAERRVREAAEAERKVREAADAERTMRGAADAARKAPVVGAAQPAKLLRPAAKSKASGLWPGWRIFTLVGSLGLLSGGSCCGESSCSGVVVNGTCFPKPSPACPPGECTNN